MSAAGTTGRTWKGVYVDRCLPGIVASSMRNVIEAKTRISLESFPIVPFMISWLRFGRTFAPSRVFATSHHRLFVLTQEIRSLPQARTYLKAKLLTQVTTGSSLFDLKLCFLHACD